MINITNLESIENRLFNKKLDVRINNSNSNIFKLLIALSLLAIMLIAKTGEKSLRCLR